MRLIALSPPLLLTGLALLGISAASLILPNLDQGLTIGGLLNYLDATAPVGGLWLEISPGWPILVLGLILGEAGLVQERVLAVKEQKMLARLRALAEEHRASERHADMLARRQRRMSRILNRAA
ncbi:exported hypothetical protein [Rhodospirillaceae bacterium LM-1]|nr:exported hypothetical protein [Rhodospirillaceae bacterium LM-1]